MSKVHMEGLPFEVCTAALNRIPDKPPIPSQCPYCQSDVVIASHLEVYGKRYGKWPWMYICTNKACDSRVGLHPETHIPLGTLANEALRKERMRVKDKFNALWRDRGLKRGQAYARLGELMELGRAECHFGMFDTAQCHAADKAIKEILSSMD